MKLWHSNGFLLVNDSHSVIVDKLFSRLLFTAETISHLVKNYILFSNNNKLYNYLFYFHYLKAAHDSYTKLKAIR